MSVNDSPAAALSGSAVDGGVADPTAFVPPTVFAAEAIVDLEAIRHNIRTFRAHYPQGKIMAAVKADAFGHGAPASATAALEGGADLLGFARLSEALQLRATGEEAPMFAWLNDVPNFARHARANDIDISVSGLDNLRAVAAENTGVNVHLEVETGLNRGGTVAAEWETLVAEAARFETEGSLSIRGIWSHLSHAGDLDAERTRAQSDRLQQAIQTARAAGLDPEFTHLANSSGVSLIDPSLYNMVRLGAGVYGIDEAGIGLRHAMTLTARVMQVKRAFAGEGVSYSHTYTLERDTTLALIAVGYADGLPWAAAGKAEVWLGGKRRRVAGRISMDQIMVDLGDDPVAEGDTAILFGPGTQGEPTVSEWAAWAGTLEHEIYCGIGARINRRYIN
ncbi:alanine racemase [Mycetocola lacteus]|uniref:Alanine racemase n=1 Tax=Mycetocola lacteus TaxID=76637 RepID=A0A3L7AW70_9MICO|nr:alanine racemase [Mycetocola lacteus]